MKKWTSRLPNLFIESTAGAVIALLASVILVLVYTRYFSCQALQEAKSPGWHTCYDEHYLQILGGALLLSPLVGALLAILFSQYYRKQ